MVDLAAKALTTFSVAADGGSASLGFTDEAGDASTLVLPSACLEALVMTLPDIAQQALRRKSGDPRKRLVFPLAEWMLERIEGSDALILTIATPEQFRVSFAASRDALVEIAACALVHEEAPPPDLSAPPSKTN